MRWVVAENGHDLPLDGASCNWMALESEPAAELVKSGNLRHVWRVTLPAGRVFVKCLESQGIRRRIQRCLFGDALQREWRIAAELKRRGVPIVPFLALGTVPCRSKPARTLLISQEAYGAAPLTRWFERLRGCHQEERRVLARKLVRCLATLFSTAHAKGFVHRDAHPQNVLIREWGADIDAELEAVFVDVHGGRLFRGSASAAAEQRCLAQLAHATRRELNHGDRLRFLRAYTATFHRPTDKQGPGQEKQLWHFIAREADRHAERLARHRDRRLRRNGTYFARLSLREGWTACLVLKLARRRVFPEQSVPDRTAGDWKGILATLLTSPCGAAEPGIVAAAIDAASMWPANMIQRLTWTLLGSPARRRFEESHRQRHRDLPAPLILGYAEHRVAGLIDHAVILTPLGSKPARIHAELLR